MIADEIDYHLIGDDLQGVIVTLDPEEAVVAEAGAMMYMQDGIRMMTSLDMTGRGGNKLMDRLFAAGIRKPYFCPGDREVGLWIPLTPIERANQDHVP